MMSPEGGAQEASERPREGLRDLLRVLDLESLDTDLFRSTAAGEPGHRPFGGQVAAQALVAAERTTGEAAAAQGSSFQRDGTLIATVVQEGLVHASRTPAAGPAPGPAPGPAHRSAPGPAPGSAPGSLPGSGPAPG